MPFCREFTLDKAVVAVWEITETAEELLLLSTVDYRVLTQAFQIVCNCHFVVCFLHMPFRQRVYFSQFMQRIILHLCLYTVFHFNLLCRTVQMVHCAKLILFFPCKCTRFLRLHIYLCYLLF